MLKSNTIDLAIINSIDNEFNKDIYKALKPGAYLFSIDKPHKAHNSVCNIEDIGFEIKDSISYFFAENEDIKQDVICLAIKPLSEKNFAENVMKWGTGGLNIDKCRISYETTPNPATNPLYRAQNGYKIPEKGQESKGAVKFTSSKNEINPEGRYPANFIISEDIAPVLDKQSGILKSGGGDFRKKNGTSMFFKGEDKRELKIYQANQGGASRFFYNSKSFEDLLKYITILGLPPKDSKVLFIGFDNVDEIIEEINKESNVNYEAITIGGVE